MSEEVSEFSLILRSNRAMNHVFGYLSGEVWPNSVTLKLPTR